MRMVSRSLVLMLALPFLGGCYAYADIDGAAVSPGSTVRVSLDRAEAVRQIDALGGLRERVEGRVTEQTTESALALTVRQAATPAAGGRFNAFVVLPWSSLTGVEVKRFSPQRTALAAAAAGAVVVATLSVLNAITDGDPSEGPNTNDAVRIPLIRLRW